MVNIVNNSSRIVRRFVESLGQGKGIQSMSLFRISLLASAVAMMVAACTTTPPVDSRLEAAKKLQPGQQSVLFEEATFEAMPHVAEADWVPALEAFKKSCTKIAKKPGWEGVCLSAQMVVPEGAKNFFIGNFVPYQAISIQKKKDMTPEVTEVGKMTGYYEPILYGSRKKQGSYIHPLHTMPDDLIVVDLAELYPQLKGMRLRGQIQGNKLVPYDSRAEMAKKRKSLDRFAIAWVEDPVAAFFLQVQGSGRIVLPNGEYMRVGYGDVNGHPYHGIGRYLVSKGYLKSHELSMQSIRAWAKANPRRVQSVLNQNPSYVFFVERTDQKADDGPLGAQSVPLVDKGSVAVDRRYYDLGWPLVVDVKQTNPDMAFTRAVVAQDTGGAIKGPIRFDFYWGSGDEAGEAAGRQNSQVRAWVLLPRGLEPPKK